MVMAPGKDGEITYEEENGNDEADEQESVVGTLTRDEEETPKAGMIFQSEEEVRNYYNNYAKCQGFGIAKISTKNGDDGKQKYFSLACARNGKTVTTVKESFRLRPSTKTNCKAKINIAVRDDGRYIITRVYFNHNHGLTPGKVREFRCNKVLGSRVKRKLEQNDVPSITLSKNNNSLLVEAGGYENLSFGECRNYIAKTRQLRLGFGDAEALGSYFFRMQNRNSNFFYMIDVDEECRIRNVFWADARCRAAYESFGDVISIDSTYLTNSYDMPFASFVGVNHHGQSVLFGCSLLSSEDTNTFVWLFKAWLTCVLGRSPKAIVTDQCKAIQAAVAEVFPNSRHRLCLWHIMKKVPVKLGGLAQYRLINKTLKNIVYESIKPDEFEKDWMNMIEKYNLENNEWLESLYRDRHRWVPVYVKHSFWAGMSATHRSERMIAFFDDYVHSKTTLKQFVDQYDNALKSKVEKESNADFASFNSTIPTITSLGIEKQFQNVYTIDIFKQVQDELRGLIYSNATFVKAEGSISTFEVTESVLGKDGMSGKEVAYEVLYNEVECAVQCLCHLFEFRGILCRHAISVLIKKRVNEVPSHYILDQWRKDVKRGYTFVNGVYDDFGSNEQRHRHNKLSPLLFEVQQLAAESENKCDLLTRILGEAKEKLLAIDSRNEYKVDQIVKKAKTASQGKRKENLGQSDSQVPKRKVVYQKNPVVDESVLPIGQTTSPVVDKITTEESQVALPGHYTLTSDLSWQNISISNLLQDFTKSDINTSTDGGSDAVGSNLEL